MVQMYAANLHNFIFFVKIDYFSITTHMLLYQTLPSTDFLLYKNISLKMYFWSELFSNFANLICNCVTTSQTDRPDEPMTSKNRHTVRKIVEERR